MCAFLLKILILRGVFVWEHSHINSAVDQQMHHFMHTKKRWIIVHFWKCSHKNRRSIRCARRKTLPFGFKSTANCWFWWWSMMLAIFVRRRNSILNCTNEFNYCVQWTVLDFNQNPYFVPLRICFKKDMLPTIQAVQLYKLI